MPQDQYELDGLTVLHMSQPVEGGVARVVTDLVHAQVQQRGAGRGGLPARRRAPAPRPPARRRGTALARRPLARPRTGPRDRGAARLVRGVRPGLLHLHSAKAGLAGRLAARGRVPTVFQPHAWSFEAVSGPTARAAAGWERCAARWADRVLCVSEAERDVGRTPGSGPAGRSSPTASTPSTSTRALHRPSVRAALPALSDLGDGTPLVVCVGRLCPQKGQDVLLRAWPAVAARLPAARLVLVGDGPDHRRLLRDAPAGVLLAGATADPLPWYQAADAVVLPSRWEGMALAPLEAMACGRPVVLTDVDGARESVPPADADGCVVPPGDPGALAEALLRLLTDPGRCAAAGLRALSHARAHHDIRATAAAVSALYAPVLPRRSPQGTTR